jgi:hypothetical protein
VRDFFKIFTLGVFVLLSSACTRVTEDNTRLSLTLPSVGEGAQSVNSQLGYLVINVSGPGIPKTLVFPFDRNEDQIVSNSVVIEVPAGESRLVQALAVYFDDSTKKISLYYGDAVASLSGVSATLALQVQSVSSGADIVSGRVSGRYSASAGVNPTGNVAVKFNPGSNKPMMIIERGFIFEGWFSLFGLAGVPLIYEVEDTGEILFSSARSLDSFAPSAEILVAQVPVHKRGMSDIIEEPAYHVIGWFGSYAATRKVCLPASGSFSNMKVAANSATSLSANVKFAPPFYPLSTSQMYNWNSEAVRFMGGVVDSSETLCIYSADYINKIPVTISQFDGQGNDKATGFRVPLQKKLNGKFIEFLPVAGTPAHITGTVLPGAENRIRTVQVFKKVGPGALDDKFDDDRPFPCLEMPSRGYVPAGSAVVQYENRVFIAQNVINSVTDLNQGGLAIGLCFADASGRRAARGGFIPAYEFE